MKTSTVGLVLAAILMVLASVGIGIAQAAGNQSYDPMLKFGDQDVNPYVDMDWQAREAVETGSLPAESNVDNPSNIATEEDVYQGSGIIDRGGNESGNIDGP